MFRSVFRKLGATLERAVINGKSSSSSLATPAKYFLFRIQNQNVAVISNSRVTSIFHSFSTTSTTTTINNNNNKLTSPDSDSSFVVSYLINSCGLSENESITASKKLNFKTQIKPDSVLALLKAEGFTEFHISKLIPRHPAILSSIPHRTLKPKFDFFKSKGIYGLHLANFILNDPKILRRSLNKEIISTFDTLKSIVQSDQNVIKIIMRNPWIISQCQLKKVILNLELLRSEGVPQANTSKLLTPQPITFTGDADRFKEIVEKVKEMGFDPLKNTFLIAIQGFASMSEANWIKKMDVYKRWGWSEDQIQSAFRKNPRCMMVSEKKIMAVMNFLVNDMGYDSSSIAEYPKVLDCSLKERILPRCCVIRILLSRGLIKDILCLRSFSVMANKSFLDKFVHDYELEVPELMKVFLGQLSYQDLVRN